MTKVSSFRDGSKIINCHRTHNTPFFSLLSPIAADFSFSSLDNNYTHIQNFSSWVFLSFSLYILRWPCWKQLLPFFFILDYAINKTPFWHHFHHHKFPTPINNHIVHSSISDAFFPYIGMIIKSLPPIIVIQIPASHRS